MGRPMTPRSGAPPRRSTGPRRVASLFLLVVFARPAGDGGPQPLLVFVLGADVKAALARAVKELVARGWREVELQSAKALPTDPADEPDDFAREAMARALVSGFDLISYGV